jgi:hypothetical protein
VLARVRPDPKLLNGLVGPALATLNLAWPPEKKPRARSLGKTGAKLTGK